MCGASNEVFPLRLLLYLFLLVVFVDASIFGGGLFSPAGGGCCCYNLENAGALLGGGYGSGLLGGANSFSGIFGGLLGSGACGGGCCCGDGGNGCLNLPILNLNGLGFGGAGVGNLGGLPTAISSPEGLNAGALNLNNNNNGFGSLNLNNLPASSGITGSTLGSLDGLLGGGVPATLSGLLCSPTCGGCGGGCCCCCCPPSLLLATPAAAAAVPTAPPAAPYYAPPRILQPPLPLPAQKRVCAVPVARCLMPCEKVVPQLSNVECCDEICLEEDEFEEEEFFENDAYGDNEGGGYAEEDGGVYGGYNNFRRRRRRRRQSVLIDALLNSTNSSPQKRKTSQDKCRILHRQKAKLQRQKTTKTKRGRRCKKYCTPDQKLRCKTKHLLLEMICRKVEEKLQKQNVVVSSPPTTPTTIDVKSTNATDTTIATVTAVTNTTKTIAPKTITKSLRIPMQ